MILSSSVSRVWRASGLDESEILKKYRQCGFGYICDEPASLPRDPEERVGMFERSGVKVSKVRAFKTARKDELIALMDYCALAGAKTLVADLLTDESWDRQRFMELNRAYLADLSEEADKRGVLVLIEHAGPFQTPYYTHCSQELAELLRKGDCGAGINLNIGNVGLTELNLYPEIRLIKQHIRGVDASDNFFAMSLAFDRHREDLGLAPLMGFLDYDEVMRGLKEAGYEGDFNLRLNYPAVFEKTETLPAPKRLEKLPVPLLESFTVWTRQVCEYMACAYDMPLKEVHA